MTRFRFPVQTLPMMFISAILATCAGDNEDMARVDQAPVPTNNVAQVKVVETQTPITTVPATPKAASN